MKAGEKTLNLLACIAFVLAASLGMQAWELSTERQLTVEQTQKLQGQLTQQLHFANEHNDYKTYKIKLLDKQKKLEEQAEQNLSLNHRLQRLQKQAQTQSILLSSMQMEGKISRLEALRKTILLGSAGMCTLAPVLSVTLTAALAASLCWPLASRK